MGIFDLFNNRRKQDELLIKKLELEVTKRKFFNHQNNKESQIEMVPITVETLLKLGVKKGDQLKLEFFFYGKDKEMAELLAATLKNEFLYDTEELVKTQDLWVITGWTTPQPILTELIQKWTEEMCNLALKFDAEFDGWGTTHEQ